MRLGSASNLFVPLALFQFRLESHSRVQGGWEESRHYIIAIGFVILKAIIMKIMCIYIYIYIRHEVGFYNSRVDGVGSGRERQHAQWQQRRLAA